MENKNVFEETVVTLIEDAKKLQAKFSKCQENNDFRSALDTMRLLKDTLSLIKEYDWELKYSELETTTGKQLKIWEQNHCGEIRNHNEWIVNENHEENNINNKWINLLEPFILNEQSMLYKLSYVNHDEEKLHRGTGKSTAIEELAIKYDLPIFTSAIRAKEFNYKMNSRQYRNKNTSRAFSTFNSFEGSNSRIILVDEGFIDNGLYESLIKDHELILIGFSWKFK